MQLQDAISKSVGMAWEGGTSGHDLISQALDQRILEKKKVLARADELDEEIEVLERFRDLIGRANDVVKQAMDESRKRMEQEDKAPQLSPYAVQEDPYG